MNDFVIGLADREQMRASMLEMLSLSERGMEIRLILMPGSIELEDWIDFFKDFFLIRHHEQLPDGRIVFEFYPTVKVLH